MKLGMNGQILNYLESSISIAYLFTEIKYEVGRRGKSKLLRKG